MCLRNIILILFLSAGGAFSQTVTFDDTNADTMFVSNGVSYELALLKHNGDLAYLREIRNNAVLVFGTELEAQWTFGFMDYGFISASGFLDMYQNQFTYEWNESNSKLILSYIPDPNAEKQLRVTIRLIFGQTSYFDMQLSLTNNWNDTIFRVSFPENLSLIMGDDDSAVIPSRYPGMMLFPEFFVQEIIFHEFYPDYMHADYVSINTQGSNLSVYTHNEGLKPMHTGFGFFPETKPSTYHNYKFVHEYTTWIENDSSWISPVSRFRIGESTVETLKAYRKENKIDEFPSLKTKLGDQFEEYARSPLHFYHYHIMDEPLSFKELPSLIEQVTSPALVMLTSYYAGGVHGLVPDVLPPDPRWGTPEDFQQMISDIKAQGKKTLLATLPVWWHENSPTMLDLGQDRLHEVASLDMDRNPYYYAWTSDGKVDWGYFVSPHSPFVINKLNWIIDQFFNTYGVDIFYDDVLGTPGFGYDFNVHAPSPTDFHQGWFDYLKNDSSHQHFVEFAYDKMAKYAIASMGHNRWDKLDTLNYWNHEPGKPIWNPYPTAPILINDIMANYHWGSNPGYENTSYNIQFAVPMGINIGFQEYGDPGGYWDRLTRDFQTDVLSRLYGKQMVDYTIIPGEYTIADYGDIKVTKSWNYIDTLHLENYSLPPSGVLVESDDGRLVAGIFSGFNGEDLSGETEWEDHYIIQLSTDSLITIKHPYSKDTPINIRKPSRWTDSEGISILCTTQEGTIGEVTSTIEERSILFDLNATYNNETVSYYEISYHPEGGSDSLPKYYLYQNYPNPFYHQTSIEYYVPEESHVILKIYNLDGQEIKTLSDKVHQEGNHSINWDGTNDGGFQVPQGIYIYKLKSDKLILANKMLKVRL